MTLVAAGRTVRLDDVDGGGGFLLITRDLDAAMAMRTLGALPLRVIALGGEDGSVHDLDGRLDAFLDALGWLAMIVRPDFYVYGGAEDAAPYEINAPGRVVRTLRSAMRAGISYAPVAPLRLGHILVFTPDVLGSVRFMTEALGMGLADRAQDVIAFCCARSGSDHHVVAFAKSPAIGFHHASFQVADPDEVGRGGRKLADRAARGEWGFGRHTIGSNFFHYIQDPWGSWFEYYSDMDHIEDYSHWTPTNYAMDDSLANWGPAVPHDFVHNYEADEVDFRADRVPAPA